MHCSPGIHPTNRIGSQSLRQRRILLHLVTAHTGNRAWDLNHCRDHRCKSFPRPAASPPLGDDIPPRSQPRGLACCWQGTDRIFHTTTPVSFLVERGIPTNHYYLVRFQQQQQVTTVYSTIQLHTLDICQHFTVICRSRNLKQPPSLQINQQAVSTPDIAHAALSAGPAPKPNSTQRPVQVSTAPDNLVLPPGGPVLVVLVVLD